MRQLPLGKGGACTQCRTAACYRPGVGGNRPHNVIACRYRPAASRTRTLTAPLTRTAHSHRPTNPDRALPPPH
ncbi:hypothetical protein Apa02nite_052170 [Actinoplanes palleronii]|uniref:Uncharacterized protein n=1 Tax=Actinoplanes palleronii TaxID=113570 RepID=A0ABQ4BEJ0_9ACTN|nr:hypothetical protein Apa02nite_052170 [Actinoplanes palleronii]